MKSFVILLLICTTLLCTLAHTSPSILKTRQQYHHNNKPLQDVVIPPINVTSYFDPSHPGVVHFQIMINTMEYEVPGTSLKISLASQPPQQQQQALNKYNNNNSNNHQQQTHQLSLSHQQQQQYNIGEENPFKFKIHNVTCPVGSPCSTTCSIDRKIFVANLFNDNQLVVDNISIEPQREQIIVLFNNVMVLLKQNQTSSLNSNNNNNNNNNQNASLKTNIDSVPVLNIEIPSLSIKQEFQLLVPTTDQDYEDEQPDPPSGGGSGGITNFLIFIIVVLGIFLIGLLGYLIYRAFFRKPDVDDDEVKQYLTEYETKNETGIVKYYKKHNDTNSPSNNPSLTRQFGDNVYYDPTQGYDTYNTF